MSELLVPFQYGYMLNAMWVSALVGGVCAFLSAYLMLKGWSLIGDALVATRLASGVGNRLRAGRQFNDAQCQVIDTQLEVLVDRLQG